MYFYLEAGRAKTIATVLIDVGIWGTHSLSPVTKYQLETAIEESIIPYFVDAVDFSRVGEGFKKEALKHIELWNCPKNLKPILKA